MFDFSFEGFQFFLEVGHFGSPCGMEFDPGLSDKILEFWMGKPEGLKAERAFRSITWPMPLEFNRPVVRS